MAQAFNQTVNVQFNKGLITENSELNFPDEASVDELNCTLFKAGNRTKRRGIKYEDDYVLSTVAYPEGTLVHTATWENVGGNADLEFLVVQIGATLRFYKKGSFPLSSGVVTESDSSPDPAIIDLTEFEFAGGLGAGASKVDVASIVGYLVVASPNIETFFISYLEKEGEIFYPKKIDFKIRDYAFYSDPSEFSKAIPKGEVSAQRVYDTQNSGWEGGVDGQGGKALKKYLDDEDKYPALTHPWYSGKNSDDNFSVKEWKKIYSGTSLLANGHFIIDLFSEERRGAKTYTDVYVKVLGILSPFLAPAGTEVSFETDWEGKPLKNPRGRFNTVTSYAGRAWYSGVDSRVYYSKIVESSDYFGQLYSTNDPTSETLSDVLATDGGYINLPEAIGIKKLHVFGASLLVFAENGVWRVSGSDGNLFAADDFTVYKISDFGLAYRSSFVAGQNSIPFWWSYSGIHTVAVTEDGGMIEQNLSRETIQTFWNDIGSFERGFVTSIYDALENKIIWMYPSKEETTDYKLNRLLFLDADLGAFYPWEVKDREGLTTPYVIGASFYNGKGSSEVLFNVVDSQGNQVIDSNGDEVVVRRNTGTLGSSNVYFLVRDPSGSITFALFNSLDFKDWGTSFYPAFAESSYNFKGDLGRRKTSPYITVFMRQTETGFVQENDYYLPVCPSSLRVSAYWDFKKTPATPPQEAYRHKHPVVFESIDEFPSPTTVLSTRLRLRGRGRSVRLRFEGKDGHDFNLLGWETLDVIKGDY